MVRLLWMRCQKWLLHLFYHLSGRLQQSLYHGDFVPSKHFGLLVIFGTLPHVAVYTYIGSVHENHRTHRTFSVARPKCLMRDFTNLNRILKAHRTNVWWIMKVFQVHCIGGQWPTKWRSPIGQWAASLGRHVLVTFSEQGTNKPLGTTKSFIKSQNSTACISSFVVRIQLKILHDIDKSVFLTVTKFWSDTTGHFSAVTE